MVNASAVRVFIRNTRGMTMDISVVITCSSVNNRGTTVLKNSCTGMFQYVWFALLHANMIWDVLDMFRDFLITGVKGLLQVRTDSLLIQSAGIPTVAYTVLTEHLLYSSKSFFESAVLSNMSVYGNALMELQGDKLF